MELIKIEVVCGEDLSDAKRATVKTLLDEAYEIDFAPFMAQLSTAVHVLAWKGDLLVCHACWITRWLRAGDGPLWRTAYVEAVATAVHARRRGLAARVMRVLIDTVTKDAVGYDIAALSPSEHAYYERLGWTLWQGPLFERTENGLIASPADEEVMIYRLPNTPKLDMTQPLSIEWRELEVW